ncbi:fimbrial protein [Nitratiruptor sp. YY09-18]|nr:fimbrial protein [Nitratiruptor sp. YY09-18]
MVVIGVLAAIAIPKFRGLTSHSKITAEIATASTIQTAIDDVHSDWIVSENGFSWGNNRSDQDLNSKGYPKKLGDCPPAFNWILKNSNSTDAKWSCEERSGKFYYHGPASNPQSGVKENGASKPDHNDCWIYDPNTGTFSFSENCSG